MKLRCVIALGVLLPACVVVERPAPAPGAYEDVRRTVAVLDELADDYPRAVQGGAAVDPARLDILRRALHLAEGYARGFPEPERAALAQVTAAAVGLAEPRAVVAAARELRGRLVASHQTVIGPGAPPSLERARQNWASQCAACHGVKGGADGPQAIALAPLPRDFLDPDALAEMQPSRGYAAIEDGRPGTAMPQWGIFSSDERWGLVFLSFAFRFPEAQVERGRAALLRVDAEPALAELADLTDGALEQRLGAAGLSASEARDGVAFLRARSAFAPLYLGAFGPVRSELAGALRAARAGDDAEAAVRAATARRALASRIDRVRAADALLAARLEARIAEVEAALHARALPETVERHVVNLEPLLSSAAAATPGLAGALRLVLEWSGAAALALGLWWGRGRRSRIRGAAAATLFAFGWGSALATVAPLGTAGLLALGASLALGLAAAAAGARLPAGELVEAAALAAAAAAAAGRVAWALQPLGEPRPWRIDALGLYPAAAAWAAALVLAAATLLPWLARCALAALNLKGLGDLPR